MEGNELTSREKLIFETLKTFNQQKTLYSLEENDKELYKNLLENLLANVAVFAKENPKELNLLMQIYNIINENNKRLKFSQLLGENFIEAMIPYNIAFFYQKLTEPQNALTHITIAVVELEGIIRSLKNGDFSVLLSPQMLLAQFYLQTTAIYSQVKEHAKALKLAEQALAHVISIVRALPKHWEALSQNCTDAAERLVAQTEILLLSIEKLKQPCGRMQLNAFRFFNWTHNTENQQKYFPAQGGESAKLQADWLENYAIADMMFLSLMSLERGSEHLSGEESLIHLVNLLAVACFSVATEKRILGNLEVQRKPAGDDSPLSAKNLKLREMRKNAELRQNSRYIESEFYYTQSIEILHGLLQKSLIKNSLIVGYHTHYSPTINHITEEEDASYTVSRLERKPFLGLSNLSLIEASKDETHSPSSGRNLFPVRTSVSPLHEEGVVRKSSAFLTGDFNDFRLDLRVAGRGPLEAQRPNFAKKLHEAVQRYNVSFDFSKPEQRRGRSLTDRGLTPRFRDKLAFFPSPVLQKTMLKTPARKASRPLAPNSLRFNPTGKNRGIASFVVGPESDAAPGRPHTCKCCAVYRRGRPSQDCFYHRMAAMSKLKVLGTTTELDRLARAGQELGEKLRACRSREGLPGREEPPKRLFPRKHVEELPTDGLYQLGGMGKVTRRPGEHARSHSTKSFASLLSQKHPGLSRLDKTKNFF